MLCKNCGNEVSNTERFCGKCGSPVAQAPTPTPANTNFDLNSTVSKVKTNKLAQKYAILAALFVVEFFLWFTEAFSVWGYGISFPDALEMEDRNVENMLMIIVLIIGIVGALLPLIKNTFNERKNIWIRLASFASGYSCAYYIFVGFVTLEEAGSLAKFTGTAWLFIACSIVSVVLTVMIDRQLKKGN